MKVGGSLARANRDDLDKLLDIGEELDIPVRVDTYMIPATRERDLPYNMQSRLNPEEAARARILALKREMGAGGVSAVCLSVSGEGGSPGACRSKTGTYVLYGRTVFFYHQLAGRDAPLRDTN